jgi:Ni/Fe-hydrogenase subunit HybB-like protein
MGTASSMVETVSRMAVAYRTNGQAAAVFFAFSAKFTLFWLLVRLTAVLRTAVLRTAVLRTAVLRTAYGVVPVGFACGCFRLLLLVDLAATLFKSARRPRGSP